MRVQQAARSSPRRPSGGFARFGAAVGLANLGDGIAMVAWAWTASLLTRDPLWIAVLPAALRLPWVLVSLPSGILADRHDRRRLIVACDLARALAYAGAAAAIFLALPLSDPPLRGLGEPALYTTLLCLGLVIGCAEVARDNAAQSLLPALVAPQDLERANGILGSIETVGNDMAGPAIGAISLAVFLPAPFCAIALAFLGAALLTGTLPGSFTPASTPGTRPNWRAELREGVQVVTGQPMLRLLVLVTGFWGFFAAMAMIALILHLQENLGSGATTYGLVLAAGALGGVAGGIGVARLLRVFRRGALAQWMALAASPLFLLIAVAPGPATVALALFLFTLSGVIWDTISVSYRQRVVPDAIRGRVNSVYRLFAWGMSPLGLVASGLIVKATEAPLGRSLALTMPFLIAALGIALLAALSWQRLGTGFAESPAPARSEKN